VSASATQNADVIVIGAGITGLSTAYEMPKAGRSVLVLEASDRVGGRIITRERNGDRVEVGTRYLLSGYENALALVDEPGMRDELVKSPETVAQFIDAKGRSRLSRGETDIRKLLGVRGSADLARAVPASIPGSSSASRLPHAQLRAAQGLSEPA
jgi:monoamine oxidase